MAESNDVVTQIDLSVRASDLDSAGRLCRPLATALDAVDVRCEQSSSGSEDEFECTLTIRTPGLPGEGTEQALRRIAVAQLAAMRLGPEHLELVDVDGRLVARVFLMGEKLAGGILPGCYSCVLVAELDVDPANAAAGQESWADYLAGEVNDLASELTALVESMHAIRVGMIAEVYGADSVDAREIVRDLAHRLRPVISAKTGTEIDLSEPEPLDDGMFQIGALVGATDLTPREAVERVIAAMADHEWSTPERQLVDDHLAAEGTPDVLAEKGISRLWIHAAPGLAVVGRDLE